MAARVAANAHATRIAFGSRQERKMFPLHCAPNRTGNEQLALHGSPELGPGCYDNHVVGTITYNFEKRPQSIKGYVLAARTVPRFPRSFQENSMDGISLVDDVTVYSRQANKPDVHFWTITPSPQKYQQDWSVSRVSAPARTPFSSSAQRFSAKSATVSSIPGPGTYAHDVTCNRKVSWPMKFSSPDWSRVPALERRSLHTELLCDKQFRTQRNRVAYLRLYYP